MIHDWLELPFTITTPMFCGRGGPDGPMSDGVRVPEIRAAAAWWFRAMVASSCTDGQQLLDLHRGVFGAATMEGTDHRSTFALRLTAAPALTRTDRPLWLFNNDDSSPAREAGAAYLLGQGLYTVGSRHDGTVPHLVRVAIEHGATATGVLAVRGGDARQRISLAAGLWALSALGGLGSRSRRCFGGISFAPDGLAELGLELHDDEAKASKLDPSRALGIAEVIREAWGRADNWADGEPRPPSPTSALAPGLWNYRRVGLNTPSMSKALGKVGRWYRHERTVPRPKDDAPPHRQRTTPEYKDDLAAWLGSGARIENPYPMTTAAFGLPIGMRTSGGQQAVIEPTNRGQRWPSPLWFRLNEGPGGQWSATAHVFRTFEATPQMSLTMKRERGSANAVLNRSAAVARLEEALAHFPTVANM